MKNRYQNKYFSVLGDSVSTLDGYSIPQDAVFYEGMRKLEADVYLPEDTWWGSVISHLGGRLLVNHSFSGSMVCKHRGCSIPSYACSDERTAALGRDGILPDVILIFMGINDWGCGMKLCPEREDQTKDLSVFSVAYRCMLEKLRANYPHAELWCLTLPVSICERMGRFSFPYCAGGRHIAEYCDVIRACAEEQGCRVIDLYRCAKPYDTVDGCHPNAAGMKTLAAAVIAQLHDAMNDEIKGE